MKKINFIFLTFIFINTTLYAQQTRQTILFNDGWKFYKGDVTNPDEPSLNDAKWRQVDLPHDWSIEGPYDEKWASATAYLPAGIGWYRKTFKINPNLRSKNIFLYFDGVYKNSEVWINGHYLGKRPNGFIPFQYEITPFLNKNGKNLVTVKADHTKFADSRWYTGSGIYRNVYLIAADQVHVDLWGIRFTTAHVNEQSATAKVSVSVINQSSLSTNVFVRTKLQDKKGKTVSLALQQVIVNAGGKTNTELTFKVNKPSLWSTDHPELYNLVVTLTVNGKQIDYLAQKVGFRSFKFDKDKGFFLNGKNMKLKGVCIHDDAGALGVAVPEEVWVRRLNILKEAGCNSLRLSHNPHADYMYDLSDRMGFLVIEEAFDEWEGGKNKWIKGWNVGIPGTDGYHSDFREWADRDVADMVLRNLNHPSIILWSIGNEIDYPNDPYTNEILTTGRNPQIYGKGYTPDHPDAKRLKELANQLVAAVKKCDTTRPVTAALAGVVMSNEVGYPEVLDIVGYNYQEYRYDDDHKKYPERIIYGSENGMQLGAWNSVIDNDYISGQYLWTGVDYLGEAHSWPSKSNSAGLIDLAGFIKPQFYFRQSLWTYKPMIYIATSPLANKANNIRNIVPSWNYKKGDSIRISCFTNCDSAELFINGKSSGKKQLSNATEKIITWNTFYQPGELLVKGFKNGKEEAHYILKTAGDAYSMNAYTDKKSFDHNKKQLCHIEINVVDENGIFVCKADNEITVNIAGPAKLLGLESGSPISHEDYKSNKRKVFNGKLLAYIQSEQKKGIIKITLTSPHIQTKVIEFK